MDDKERIEYIIKEMSLSNVEFSQLTGIAPATISHITSGRSKPTLPILKAIVMAFPELNPQWVFMGEGPVYSKSEAETDNVVSEQPVLRQTGTGGLDLFSTVQPNVKPRTAETVKAKPQAQPAKTMDVLGLKEVIKASVDEAIGRRKRQIVEVRIFFDDGTYEAFSTPK